MLHFIRLAGMIVVASTMVASAQPFCQFSKDPGPIVVTSVTEKSVVPAKFILAGKANCGWFFESSFPVAVRSPYGRLLWQGPAITAAEWIYQGMHTFTADIDVGKYTGPIIIELMRDNESDDRSADKKVFFHVSVR